MSEHLKAARHEMETPGNDKVMLLALTRLAIFDILAHLEAQEAVIPAREGKIKIEIEAATIEQLREIVREEIAAAAERERAALPPAMNPLSQWAQAIAERDILRRKLEIAETEMMRIHENALDSGALSLAAVMRETLDAIAQVDVP